MAAVRIAVMGFIFILLYTHIAVNEVHRRLFRGAALCGCSISAPAFLGFPKLLGRVGPDRGAHERQVSNDIQGKLLAVT